jgi:hydrogenase expression/formation protein HypE
MESINLQHGSGGEKQTELLNNLIFKNLGNEFLDQKHDGAFRTFGKLAFSTDSFVVSPIFLKAETLANWRFSER